MTGEWDKKKTQMTKNTSHFSLVFPPNMQEKRGIMARGESHSASEEGSSRVFLQACIISVT